MDFGLIVVVIAILFGSTAVSNNAGYRQGQIDAQKGHLEYVVTDDGRILQDVEAPLVHELEDPPIQKENGR